MTDKMIYGCLMLYALASSLSIAISNIAIAIAAVAAMIRYWQNPFPIPIHRGLFKALAIFFSIALVSAVFSYYPMIALKTVANYIYRMLPLFLVVAFVKEKKQILTLLAVMVVSILIADGKAIWQGFHGDFRARAFAAHPMIFAGYLLQMLPLMFVFLFKYKMSKDMKIWLGAGFLLSLLAFVFNGTRGAWIGVSGAILLSILNMRMNKKIIFGSLLGIFLCGIMFFQVPMIQQRILTIGNLNDISQAERLLNWQSSWKMFQDHPIIGVGFGNFKYLYLNQYISPLSIERVENAHNVFLHAMAEMGIIGLIAYLYLFAYILHICYKRTHGQGMLEPVWGLAALSVTVSLLIQGFTQYNFGDSAVIRMYWFILGLMHAGWNLHG